MGPGNTPNKAQTDWREEVRSMGCVYGYGGNVEIHHPLGRTATSMGQHIGHWLVIPVSTKAHREIEALPKDEQIRIFLRDVVGPYLTRFYTLPMSVETLAAIGGWSR